MKRRLFTILSALSLLLCVAVCVLWVRSHFVADTLMWYRDDEHAQRTESEGTILFSAGGGFSLDRSLYVMAGRIPDVLRTATRKRFLPKPGFSWTRDLVRVAPYADDSTLGFYWHQSADDSTYELRREDGGGRMRATSWAYGFAVPYWSVALLTGVSPVYWLVGGARRRVRSRVRSRRGLCPSCGYDLRVTPGRCPECGAVPAKAIA